MPAIHFFYEDIEFSFLKPRFTKQWIKKVIISENKKLGELNYIFCSDDHLLKINTEYLDHSSYTDIITFDLHERSDYIQGDIYISLDRVKYNALRFKTEFDLELHRVIIHGVLHLLGYSDKTKSEKTQMRKKEDAYLSLLKFSFT